MQRKGQIAGIHQSQPREWRPNRAKGALAEVRHGGEWRADSRPFVMSLGCSHVGKGFV